jgi:hypothetical protein
MTRSTRDRRKNETELLEEWEDAMKSSNTWVRNVKAVARTVTVLVLAVIIVGMSITPVLARDGEGDRGRKEYHGQKAYHGHAPYRGRGGYYDRGGYYPAPVYAPPPVVYYPPPPPPGINFVFPIRIR